MENMVKMRNEQFSEVVMRSLYGVASSLEQDETKHYLDQDIDESEAMMSSMVTPMQGEASYGTQPIDADTASHNYVSKTIGIKGQNFDERYQHRQEILKGQYIYQRGLLTEVILTILSQSSNRPIMERADSAVVRRYLKQEFASNGLTLPFEFAVINHNNAIVYRSSNYSTNSNKESSYKQILFPNDPQNKQNTLRVTFPTKSDYIFSSIKFMLPSFAFSFVLLFIFIYTIIIAFKQKKLTEIKNDFINNMTHEFKTPISTISLAAQMLNDDTVCKSPTMLKHATTVINDETKRLRFQVEKVLQMSMFDRKSATMRLQEVDANAVIDNVINTYSIKVEKFGGKIESHLDAEDAVVNVDEMHFTNVIFNLLDNAIKYRREEVAPHLTIATRNHGDDEIQIMIQDNGIGIKREDLKRIFEKFYRVSTGNRHDVKGFGLGLAYVNKMITLFKVESELKKGSKFIITLPLLK